MNQPVLPPAVSGRGERKQITAMFLDVAGFSVIASTADAEDLEQWLEEFYAQSRKIIEEHDGEITEYLGDGIVALFGLARADELAASKAVNAALQSVNTINAGYLGSITVQLRAGIATGEVAVRSSQTNDNLPRATGMVTTLAQRIQERAAPGTVLIAESTRILLRGSISLTAMPDQVLKGFSKPHTLFAPAPEVPQPDQRSPKFFVGRRAELIRVATSHLPCLIIGPAGIGKTALSRHIAQSAAAVATFMADGVHTRASYQPFKDWILAQIGSALPEFTDIQNCFGPFGLSAESQRALALVLGLAEGQRLLSERTNIALKSLIEDSIWQAIQVIQPAGLLVFEDLHWLDNASFGVLIGILNSVHAARYQIVMTSREDTKIGKYLGTLQITTVPLDNLSDNDAAVMLDTMSKGKVTAENRAALIERAGGIPLFLEQLLQRAHSDDIGNDSVPESLMDLLAGQIDATGASKPVLQCAASIGRNFTLDMLRVVATEFEPLEAHLSKACARGVLQENGADTWMFSHALLHRAAYQGLLRRTRVDYHSQIAAHLQNNHPDAVRRNPALLTDHLRLAQQHVPAIENYLTVSQWALFQGAFEDAEAHILAAISLCKGAPADVDVTDLEIACYTALGSIRVQTSGYMAPHVKEAFEAVTMRAQAQHKYSAAIGPAFYGSFSHAIISGDKDSAEQFSDLLLDAVKNSRDQASDSEIRLASLNVQACLHCYSGNFEQLFEEYQKLRDVYDISRHGAMITHYGVDTFAATQMFDSVGRSICGDSHMVPDLVAETDAHQKLLNIPVMRPYALIWGSVPLFYAGEIQSAIARVKKGIAIANEQTAAFWQLTGAAWLNVMDPTQSASADGIAAFEAVIQMHEAVGAKVGLPYFRAHLALAYAQHGNLDTAYQTSSQAVNENDRSGLNCWFAEILRIHAKICLRLGLEAEAKKTLERAETVAQRQNARLWLLRVRLDQLDEGLIEKAALAEAVELFHPDASPPELVDAKRLLAFA